jgi:hypothetical protein
MTICCGGVIFITLALHTIDSDGSGLPGDYGASKPSKMLSITPKKGRTQRKWEENVSFRILRNRGKRIFSHSQRTYTYTYTYIMQFYWTKMRLAIQRQRCRPNIWPTTTKTNLPTTIKVLFSNFHFPYDRHE